jgi:dienelactone hydrolase
VVVGISHTYDSVVVQFPDGRVVDGMKSITKRAKNKTAIEMLNQSDQNIEVWISDVRFVLDQLKQLANDKSSMFYQRFDQKNIGIFGHSFGGATAAQICHRDARVKAGVDLDGALFGPDMTKEFNKPFMFLLGDVTVKEAERPLTQNELKSAKISSPDEEKLFKSRYLHAIEQLSQSIDHNIYTFIFKDSGHMDFADSALIKSATRLYRLLIKLKVAGYIGMGSIDGFRATEIVNAYLVNFFNKYLKGQPSELLDGGEHVYPEVEVKQWTKE